MGKGKRIRQNRRSPGQPVGGSATTDLPADYPFVVDARTRRALGPQGLQVLADNLWPVDCQTCGWELGAAPPTVLISELTPANVYASLHHARCQPTTWTTNLGLAMTRSAMVSNANMTFLWPLQDSTGRRQDWPLVLVNPMLELVNLRQENGVWTAGTVDFFRHQGLRTPGKDLAFDRPVQDFSAELDGATLTIQAHDMGERWEATASSLVEAQLHKLGGTLLGVTTAVHPHHITPSQLSGLIASGQLVMGWIPLAGTEQPLTEMPAPQDLRTYVLHYGPGHATVGELLATTDPSLTPSKAQAWASEHIPPTGDDLPREDHHMTWEQVSGDPNAWYTIDPLSVRQFFIRRHEDAWTLVRIISRRDGSQAARSEGDVQEWATNTARILGNTRILTWIPAPTTATGFTTFHGAGTPR